jgi:hypothetical protein
MPVSKTKRSIVIHDHSIGFSAHKDENSSLNYRPLYELANRYLSKGYIVLYTAEYVPDENTKQKIIDKVVNVKGLGKVKDNIEKGALSIFNINSFYNDKISSQRLVDSYFSLVKTQKEKRKQQPHSSGILLISAPDAFFEHKRQDTFMSFEQIIGRTFEDKDLVMLCWYKRKWLTALSLADIIHVLSVHSTTVHNGWKFQKWSNDRIVNSIGDAIDTELGEGASILLFKTMKAAFKLDQKQIASKPNLFEKTLKTMLSAHEQDSENTFNGIVNTFKKQLFFSGNSKHLPQQYLH